MSRTTLILLYVFLVPVVLCSLVWDFMTGRLRRRSGTEKALREALEAVRPHIHTLNWNSEGEYKWLEAQVDAALNPSPAECDIEAGSVALKAAENEESRNHIEASRPPPGPNFRKW